MSKMSLPAEFKFVVTVSIDKKPHYIKYIKNNEIKKNGVRLFQKHLVKLTDDINEAAISNSRVKARKLITESHFIDGFVDKAKLTIDRYREPEHKVNLIMPRNYRTEWSKFQHEVMLKIGDNWAKEKMFFNKFEEQEREDLVNLCTAMNINEVRVIPIKQLKKLEVKLHNL